MTMDLTTLSAQNGTGREPLTMSSLEIAELTGKRHDNVMRDTRKMLVELHGEDRLLKFEDTHLNTQNGQSYPIYRLPKRETLVLVSGYSVEMRARIIDRWMELEAGLAQPRLVVDPSDPKVMLACFDYLQKQVAEKDAIIAVQGEKVKKLERLEGASGSMCITDAAKTLGVGRNELIQFMQARRWIYKRPGSKSWVAYDDMRRARYMEHDEHLYMSADGQERVATRALVTAKGLVKLAELLNAPLH